MNTVRKPIVADQFYEEDPRLLTEHITKCFTDSLGPGSLPGKKDKNIVAAIAPHAGFVFSGPCAACTYKEIAESRFPGLYVMLGLSHNGFPSSLSRQNWDTPLGTIAVDKDFIDSIQDNSRLRVDERSHSFEHSIEVQLPFLQYINKENLDNLRIAPIICSDDIKTEDFAQIIIDAAKDTKRKIIVIASSDFTHFGVSYGFMPFNKDIKENMYKLDVGAIEQIKKLQAGKFKSYINDTKATICGKNPIAVAMQCAKLLGAKNGELLKYYTSADIMGDYSTAVGYASIVFPKAVER